MAKQEHPAIVMIDKIVKTVNSNIYHSNIVVLAKYFNLNQQYLHIRQLRKTIGDLFITSNNKYSEDIYKAIDAILIKELQHKTIVNAGDLSLISSESKYRIKLWQGDITTLKIEAIVNAANEEGLGCFVSDHKCIDNVIHRNSGPRLRNECREILCHIDKKGKAKLATGTAIITKGYCLPSKYVIHTTGPIGERPGLLKACYKSVLNLCKKHNIRSVAFCCISTGIFGYPQENAAKVAISTVKMWLTGSSNVGCIDYVVFNVFTDRDLEIYSNLLNDTCT